MERKKKSISAQTELTWRLFYKLFSGEDVYSETLFHFRKWGKNGINRNRNYRNTF